MKCVPLAVAISIALGLSLSVAAQTAPHMPPGDAGPQVAASDQTSDQTTELSATTVEGNVLPQEGGQFESMQLRRESALLMDVLSAEQMGRSGDSDAAAALRRVTGLSLVDDRFVYVRGLGERYSSTLLNGAQIPSPDPTRRAVPLDLFPSGLLSSIDVHKSYAAVLPGEFGGGSVDLRTRGVPSARLLRAGAGLGWVAGQSGHEGLRARSGARDWLGRDDGLRRAPAGLLQRPLPARGSAPMQALAREVMDKGFALTPRTLGPDSSLSLGLGDAFGDESLRWGYSGALRWAQDWDLRDEERAEYAILGNGDLVRSESYRRERSTRNVDTSLMFSTGVSFDSDHQLDATLLRLAQTLQNDRIDSGVRGSGNDERATTSEWVENVLSTRQFGGQHRLSGLAGLMLDWQYTDSSARRDLPFARNYLYARNATGDYAYTASFPAQMRWEFMHDHVEQARLGLRLPLRFQGDDGLDLSIGGSRLRRDRDAQIWRYTVRHAIRPPSEATPIQHILAPGAVDAGAIELLPASRATDFYQAEQALDAWYARADLRLGRLRLDLGARRERNDQQVVTRNPFVPAAQPTLARLRGSDTLPSATATWLHSENAQLRLSWNRTLTRPEFRELSPAPYTDPLLDISVIGNPELRQTRISSYDLRWEYYFVGSDSLSLALFRKEFDAPIELVRTPASGDLLELRNVRSAFVRGIEFELGTGLGYFADAQWLPGAIRNGLPWYDLAISLNHTRIDSEVELGAHAGIQTSARRPLQGQSPYLSNLALTWFDPDGVQEATLLYNVAGKRISKVGLSGVPDEYEHPFGQLDFNYSRDLTERWKLRLRLRNLLDPRVEYTQGGQHSRRYRKGREIAISLEWAL